MPTLVIPRLARLAPPPRYAVLAWVAALFLVISLLTRLGLLVFEAEPANFAPVRALSLLAIGLVYDLAAASYWLVPFALVAGWFPAGRIGRKAHAWTVSALVLAAIFVMLCTAFAEFVFWNEFSSRFNFIAVDYLIYTRETLGNLHESFPLGLMFGGTAAVTIACYLVVRKPVWRAAAAEAGSFSQRFVTGLVILALPAASFFILGDGPREALPSASARELAGNGYYEFGRAFRSNDLDYQTFYRTVADGDAERQLRQEFAEARSTAVFTNGAHPVERRIMAPGAPKPLNVVLVSIESLGSDYVESFGGRPGLTPNLDRLAAEGLRFTNLYATGTRTVRGLEALSLSVPPTPGHAVPVRKNNKGFQTLGGVFKDQGYEPLYIYGGYSYFDNMNDFFGGNGYTVVDRTSLARSDISHETIWGVADEDLFKMVVREMDARAAAGKKVFAHVMTTSNHRPYTYPEGRIDIPSKTGRAGAVKYTDWAIGNFMKEASTRPWFKDTLFVFVADHTSNGRGRTDLPPENYRIPLIVYAPDVIEPRTVDTVASQIDVGPTILALLNVSYTSRFFGHDILTEGQHHQRALMANYLTVGLMENGAVVELSPKRRARILEADSGRELRADNEAGVAAIEEAISYYQVADRVLRNR
jgi:phosphoglycerol transferase MdoB-like AlkP superfamily enzyme